MAKQTTPVINPSDYITEKEAIALTGLSRTTLYFRRKEGTLKFVVNEKGRQPRYLIADLYKSMGFQQAA